MSRRTFEPDEINVEYNLMTRCWEVFESKIGPYEEGVFRKYVITNQEWLRNGFALQGRIQERVFNHLLRMGRWPEVREKLRLISRNHDREPGVF